MKYVTWMLYWEPDAHYGSGPEPVILERGGSAEGAFYSGADVHDPIVGYVYGDVSLDGLDEWNVTEITSEQALALAQELDPEASINDEGRIVFPMPDPIA